MAEDTATPAAQDSTAAASGVDTADVAVGATPTPAPVSSEPVQYSDFNIPDGFSFNDSALTGFKTLAQDARLTQEQAQKFLDLEAQSMKAQLDAYNEKVKQWAEDCKTDEVIGGADHQAKMALVAKARDTFADNDFMELCNSLQIGNHPAVNRLLYKVGKVISEDRFVQSDGTQTAKPTAAQLFFSDKGK